MTSPSPSQSPNCVGFANLPDELLVKILDHLPSQSDVVACTVVCKHWFSLISTFFKNRTIHRHRVENVKHTRITLLIKSSGLSYVGGTRITFLIKSSGPGYVGGTSSNPLLKRTGKSQLLKFLPCYMPNSSFAIHIVASFKDLLLCCQKPFESVYYLCNILTKQWFKLPRAPEHYPEVETFIGLICYPSFPCHHQNCTNLYSQYSYRVVRIFLPQLKEAQQFTAEIFCSVTGTWSKSVVSSPRPFTIGLTIGLRYYVNKNIVVCDGIMYWMSCGKKGEIVAYDPLNDTDSCRVIDLPDLELEYRGLHVPKVEASLLGVTGGRLRLLQYVGCTLWVWELEDYNKQAKWIRRARIYPIGSYFLLGFHPYDPDQVYLTAKGIVLALHVPTRILREAIEFYHDDNGLTNAAGTVFPLVHPWWPTPVPPFQS